MAPKIQHKRSAVAGKAPLPADLDYGEIGVNYEATDPALYIKDSADAIRKVGAQPDASETVKGIVELATAAETTTGTDATRAVHPAGLKVELDKKAPLASPALTGVPTAPTAAAGTNTTQLATTAFVQTERLWTRTGTTVAPKTAGDVVSISAGTAALPGLTPVGDANTGIWAPAADTLAVSTNGVERLRYLDSAVKLNVNLDVNDKTITTTVANGDVHINALGTGRLMVTERALSKVPVVTQHDIGTGTNEVPVCGMLGAQAFLDRPLEVATVPTTYPQPITANGRMLFELTSDTSLTIKVKGNDGVVRSANITLA